jgi:UDP-4-keto-D-QuiNAc 4-reductase
VIRVLVTGSSGFVGTELCRSLGQAGYLVRAALRTDAPLPHGAQEKAVVGSIGPSTDWSQALRETEVVVHCAAVAHILRPRANIDPYMEVNALGTERLVAQAAAQSVRRFVYLSSIKVNGEETDARAYLPSDVAQPRDAYGKSKLLGERAALRSSIDAVVVRSPMVYGPGVRANFLRLLRWVDAERPLPLGSIDNRRSLVSLWNLCSLLTRVVEHPDAVGRTWLVSDGEDLSTPDLIRRLAAAMQRRARLFPVPPSWLRLAGTLTGRRAEVNRLCGSLTVDIARTRDVLQWSPPLSVGAGIERTVRWYLSAGRGNGR